MSFSLGCFVSLGMTPELLVVVLVRVALRTVLACSFRLLCYLRVENGALVVLVEVLPEPVCVASTICCVLSVGHLFGLRSDDVFPERLLALWVEVLPKLPCVVFVCRCSLSVEMSCRCCRSDCPCYSLFGRVSRGVVPLAVCLAVVLARLSSCSFRVFPAALVGLHVSPGSGGWLCFSRLWAMPDGGLVSAMGVWLVVLLWKCQSRLVVFPCLWKRLVVRVSFPCFPLVARGGGAGKAVDAVVFTLW
ncbi:hypothetical protein Taro_054645 [Colocasia esculenta]|uniref:Uncharacterized protein n=1 Tax=Colocasia esculenta TaxID=4460 RepID=A0A843XR42_COLES|nr:hypothetical protein [Colocasia esculenta]